MYTIVRRRCWASTSLRVHCRAYASPAAAETKRLKSLAQKLIRKSVEVTDEVSGRQRQRGFESSIKFDTGRLPSPEVGDMSNSNMDHGWDDSRNEFDLKPGDYIEIGSHNRSASCGVVLGQLNRGRQLYTVTLTERGLVLYHLGDMVQFSIPGLISSDLASRCGSDAAPASDHQHKARLRVLKYIAALSPTIIQATFDAHAGLSDAYELLRDKDPDKRADTTLSHLTRMFKKKPTFVDLIAVHRFISQKHASFVPRRDFAVSQAIVIRSLNEKNRLNTVNRWIYQRGSPLDSFALKARPFMDQVVALRRESSLEPPSMLESPSSPSWDENDILILRYLVDSLLSAYDELPSVYSVATGNILKRLYNDASLYAHAQCYEALVDLGVLPPWQDATVHINPFFDEQVETMITKHIEKHSSPTFNAAILNPTSQPLGQEDFYPSDPMESVRHDFGDMPVYVIDDSVAKELDDGLSFEPIPGDPHGGWMHVHIADPCSIIPPTHAFASLAEKRHMSRYHPLLFDSMLPSALTGHKGFAMSLGSKDGPQRVLTFSARVSSNGDIVDYKVRSGFVNNVVVISYDTVEELMDFPRSKAKYPFGRPLGRDIHPATLTERHRADLRALYDIRTNFVARRFRDGVFLSNESKGTVVVADSPEEMPPSLSIPGRLYKGFPTFTMAVKEPLN
ncbi:RNB-domain-containing protein [Hymenopellis radicata]|nr:RNB-domain-containing protein [Hymenopellis radicata]